MESIFAYPACTLFNLDKNLDHIPSTFFFKKITIISFFVFALHSLGTILAYRSKSKPYFRPFNSDLKKNGY
jgi:hypothetical protein